MLPSVTPQLVGNNGLRALRAAISEPERFACEPKVDGVRGLVVYQPDGSIETRNRRGERRDWLRGDGFEGGLRKLANRLPILWHGTVLDGELIADQFAGTMAALYGSKAHRASLKFVVFDVPVLAGVSPPVTVAGSPEAARAACPSLRAADRAVAARRPFGRARSGDGIWAH